MNAYGLIFGAGLCAGTMNALAGGGTFVTLPALIAAGIPSVQANASSTLGLIPGSLASSWAYRDGMGPVGAVAIRPLLWVTVVGGIIGALLLMSTPSTMFDRLLPWLLLVATLALGFGRQLGERLRRRVQVTPAAVLSMQFVLGIYSGYFGGGVGIMMLAVWGLVEARDIKSLNPPRTLLTAASNVMAVVIFIVARAIRWPETVVLMVAATCGGYFGAHLGRRAPEKVIRVGTLVLACAITGMFFVRAYCRR